MGVVIYVFYYREILIESFLDKVGLIDKVGVRKNKGALRSLGEKFKKCHHEKNRFILKSPT